MSTAELFVELQCEELPASMVRPALKGLADGLLGLLEGLEHGAVRTFATPRRLAVAIADVQASKPLTEVEVTGPPADRAFDADGQPTKTGAGFARGKGVDPSELYVVELPKRGKVAAVTVREGGEKVVDLVAAGLGDLIANIPFQKKQIWGVGGLAWGRPLHTVVALYDGAVIEGEAHGIAFGNTTLGHRLTPGPLTVTSADQYVEGLRELHVEADLDARKAKVAALYAQAVTELGGTPRDEEALIEEVTHLVEWPVLVKASFDADLLELPPRLLVTSMKVHQRYFPVFADGKLTNHFVVISNNPFGDHDLIAEGNARVLRARFYDARFFFAEDRQKTLAAHGDKLTQMRWIRGLGTMADKGARLASLGTLFCEAAGANEGHVHAAAALAKADLATQMVGEFPELQGHMGRIYALAEGLPEAVAVPIEEHYLPRFAGDALAATPEGTALALADRVDSLVGCFGIGLEPKGGDPQGLRRAALGIVNTVLHHGLRLDLRTVFTEATAFWNAFTEGESQALPYDRWIKASPDPAQTADRLVGFTLARFKAAKTSEGLSADQVDAVVATVGETVDLVVLDRKLDALAAIAGTEAFPPILQTLKRVLNVGADADVATPSAEACTEDVERALLAATREVAGAVDAAEEALDYGAALDAILRLVDPVEAFFVGVMVNAEDEAVRALRLGILGEVAAQFRRIADFSRISTR